MDLSEIKFWVMKKLISSFTFIFFLFIATSLYGQLWKQYADSAKVYSDQKNTDKAIEFYNNAKTELEIDSTGTNSYARICSNLAFLYQAIGQYEKAEPLDLQAKQIREKILGKEHPEYARSCNNLAILYMNMGEYEKAAPLYMEAKEIQEKVLGKEHPEYAGSCNNLAALYMRMGQYEKAVPLLLEAKQIREKVLGNENPDYANSCNNLAVLYKNMGQYEKAEPLYTRGKANTGKGVRKGTS